MLIYVTIYSEEKQTVSCLSHQLRTLALIDLYFKLIHLLKQGILANYAFSLSQLSYWIIAGEWGSCETNLLRVSPVFDIIQVQEKKNGIKLHV